MTEKQGYEFVLMELRKAKAPSLHLEEYNRMMTKGIQEHANLRYAQFQTTQQLSDDLAPLMTSAKFTLVEVLPLVLGDPYTYSGGWAGGVTEPNITVTTGKKYGSDFFRFKTPDDYWHMTGSHVTSFTRKPFKCHPAGFEFNNPSKRLTQDAANGIINNDFLKPSLERPYHSFNDGGANRVRPDLYYYVGDNSKFGIRTIYIDYLKEPQPVNLTVVQRDSPVDTSAVLEWPEYTCNEIIKNIVKLVLEMSSDPRLQTHPPTNKSIA